MSRIKCLSVNEVDLPVLMRKLNQAKLRWIIREVRKQEQSVYRIARIQKVKPRWVRALFKRFKDIPLNQVTLKRCGSKPKKVSDKMVQTILLEKQKYGLGAVNLETILKEKGVKVSHNKIHEILKNNGLAKREPKKSKRRKWVRYERKHSNSLWHTDWMDYKGKWYIFYEDDASRFVTGGGCFTNATTDNSIKVFDRAVKKFGKPLQLLSDHGTQFCSDEEKIFRFKEHLKSKGVELIHARVKHPQTNGKLERLNFTMQGLIDRFGDLDEAVNFYNNVRPHMSLYNGHTRTPRGAFEEKAKK